MMELRDSAWPDVRVGYHQGRPLPGGPPLRVIVMAMQLTAREQSIVEHLSIVAKGKMLAAAGYSQRLPASRSQAESFEFLASQHSASAGGIIVAIAYIQGRTPMEVEAEFEAEIGVSG